MPPLLQVVTMVYWWPGKHADWWRVLQALGVNALGLTGAD